MGDCTGSKAIFFPPDCRNTGGSSFECAIDLLSYCNFDEAGGQDWRQFNLVSLAGVYSPKQKIEDSKVPVTLGRLLEKTKQSGELFFIWTMILPEEKLPKRCRLFFQISMKSLTTLPNTGKMSTTFFVNAWE